VTLNEVADLIVSPHAESKKSGTLLSVRSTVGVGSTQNSSSAKERLRCLSPLKQPEKVSTSVLQHSVQL